jgi:triphosphoribosyl-dephospho-CoA synthase
VNKLNNLVIQVQTIEDIIRCSTLSSLLELSGWPKPGNIHRTSDFQDTRFEHFLSAISAIQPSFYSFCRNINKSIKFFDQEYDCVNLGKLYLEAVKFMMEWQKGGNVLLGHILILAPLIASTTICLKFQKKTLGDLQRILIKVIADSTIEDTIYLYKAIKQAKPGGLGKIQKYDINNPKFIEELRKDRMNLKKIFTFSKDYDQISREYSEGFPIIFKLGLPYFIAKFKQSDEINTVIVDTSLKILSEFPDTLIIRKSNREIAEIVSEKTKNILDLGGISTRDGLNAALKLDEYLKKTNGQLNPGTTADILTGVIFCALLTGIRF